MDGLLEIAHPAIDLDLRYATADNICGRSIYDWAVALLHADAHAALLRAADLAEAQQLRLRVFDAYRPPAAQRCLWTALPDAEFIADPSRGSPHSRGVAVDLTLTDASGRPFDMGTGFDDMTPQSHHGDISITPQAQRNRAHLLGLMALAGWEHYIHEWWHYNLPAPARYAIVDDAASVTRLMDV